MMLLRITSADVVGLPCEEVTITMIPHDNRRLRSSSGGDMECETASWCEAWQVVLYSTMLSAMFWTVAKALYEDMAIARVYFKLQSKGHMVKARVIATASRRLHAHRQSLMDYAALVEFDSITASDRKYTILKWVKLDKDYFDLIRTRMYMHLTTNSGDSDGPHLCVTVPPPLDRKPYPTTIHTKVYNALKGANHFHHPQPVFLPIHHSPKYPRSAVSATEDIEQEVTSAAATLGLLSQSQRVLIMIVGFGFLSLLVGMNSWFSSIYDWRPWLAGLKAVVLVLAQLSVAVTVWMMRITESPIDFILYKTVRLEDKEDKEKRRPTPLDEEIANMKSKEVSLLSGGFS